MAEALRNMAQLEMVDSAEIKQLVNSAVLRALHGKVSPYKRDPREVKNLGRYGYYLEHLNIILGCYQAVVDDTKTLVSYTGERRSKQLRPEQYSGNEFNFLPEAEQNVIEILPIIEDAGCRHRGIWNRELWIGWDKEK
jgi:hypothetical protein